VRITDPDRSVEEIISLKEFRPAWGWIGLTQDAPLVLGNVRSEEIYALDVDFP
jgi:hypothetical protein